MVKPDDAGRGFPGAGDARRRPPIALDIALAILIALLHPSPSQRVKVCILAYAALCVIAPRPFFRYLLPVLGTAAVSALAAFGRAADYPDLDYAPFLLAASFWAILPGNLVARPSGQAQAWIAGLVALAAAAASLGFFLFWAFEAIAVASAPAVLLDVSDPTARTRIWAIAVTSAVALMGLWRLFSLVARRADPKLTAYAEGYRACRKDLVRLSRRWQS